MENVQPKTQPVAPQLHRQNELVTMRMYYARHAQDDDPAKIFTSTTIFDNETYNCQTEDLLKAQAPQVDVAFEQYVTQYQDLYANMQSTFRASFRLSNGPPLLQAYLMARSAQIMNLYSGTNRTLPAIAAGAELYSKNFSIPARHALPRRPHRILPRALATWDFYMDICQHPNDLDLVQPRDKLGAKTISDMAQFATFNLAPYAITELMLDREVQYMDSGRPGRSDTASRYRSLIRDYAILAKPTGSPELDVTMQEVSAVLGSVATAEQTDIPDFWLFNNIRPAYNMLQEKWQSRNGIRFLTVIHKDYK